MFAVPAGTALRLLRTLLLPAEQWGGSSLRPVCIAVSRLGAVTVTRFWRPVEIPDDLGDHPAAVRTGRVTLPNHIAWSGQGEYDLDDAQHRMRMYELVMTEGNEDDVRTYVDLEVLLGMWDTMWLAPRVREQWAASLRSRGLIS